MLSKVFVWRIADGINQSPRFAFFSDDFAVRERFSVPSRLYSTSAKIKYQIVIFVQIYLTQQKVFFCNFMSVSNSYHQPPSAQRSAHIS